MAAQGKTLTVYLAANTAGMTSGINRANQSLQGFGRGIGGMVGLTAGFGAALGTAAIQAGEFAFRLGQEGVQAAIEDEKSLTALNTTLANMGFANATTQVDTFIGGLQSLLGVSEDELRPAMAALVRTTGDVSESMDLLRLAMDISAGSGKSLQTVVGALQKAHDGNLGALKRLGLGIDETALKSGDFEAVVKDLSDTFAGQASNAANTLQGKMKRLGLAADEVKESFGRGFLDGLMNASGGLNGMQKSIEDLTATAEIIGRVLGGIVVVVMNQVKARLSEVKMTVGLLDLAWIGLLDTLGLIPDAEAAARRDAAQTNIVLESQSWQASQTAGAMAAWSIVTGESATAAGGLLGALTPLGPALDLTATSMDNVTGASGRMDSAMETGREKLRAMAAEVRQATSEYEALLQKRDQLAGSFEQGITSGVSLTGVFNPQDASAAVGDYVAAISDATQFSAGLASLGSQIGNTPGAQQFLSDIAALGATSGNSFLSQLSPEVANNIVASLDAAATTINGNTYLLANKFFEEGLEAGAQTLEGLNKKLTQSEQALIKLGKRIGEPIGAKIRDEIADAIEAAISAAARGGVSIGITSAGIRRSAGITTETDVASSITRTLARSDARSGYSTPAPLA
jgi:hypothetical protein